MSEEEILAKAYFILGLEPGAPLDTINRRYKRLIMVWHPDRFPTADGKKDAEEELKRINNAKDQLKAHFETGHKASGPCACKPSAGASSQTSNQTSGRTGQGPSPGPGKRRTTQETNKEEADAKRRNEERARKTAEQAAEKARQNAAAEKEKAAQNSVKNAVDQTKLLEDERLRWRVTLCLGAAWLGLSLFGFVGMGLKSWWHDVSWNWERDHPAHSDSTTNGTGIGTQTTIPPYVAPYNQAPGQNNSPRLWQDPYANNAQPPPNDTTASPNQTPAPSLPLAPTDPSGVRQRAQDFLTKP